MLCMAGLQLSAQHKNPEKEKQAAQMATEPSSLSLADVVQKNSSDYVITQESMSRKSGVRHVYLRQAIQGLEVYGTESSVHFDKAGNVIKENNKFLADVALTLKSSGQSISAKQAILSVANQMGYKISNLQQIKLIGGANKSAVFNQAGISAEDIPVKLMYYYKVGAGTQLVWELSIAEKTSPDWWNFRVNASTGKIIDKDNWTVSCNILGNHESHSHENNNPTVFVGPMEKAIEKNSTNREYLVPPPASYRVYAMPLESPNYGTRTLVTNPENLNASPFGWHDTDGVDGAEFTNTRGNNTDAYDDDNANNNPDGKYATSPGGNLVFDFPLNTNYSNADQSENAAITNLFYWSNIIHDVTYQYGFDEANGNFQQNNYGKGGIGNDPVNSEAQDGSGTCNANFGTPADGARPRMQMYICNARDGDLDNGVIIHEYAHGISNRLTGGPAAVSCLQNQEQMGEGWSDYYGLMLTMKTGDAGPNSRGIGTWLLGEGPGGPGIRVYPYSTNFAVNPHTYNSIITAVAPHGVGSVWAAMLWEMTWEIMATVPFNPDIYNGTGGNNVALAIVTEGLKLQPCSPGFVDGRDAILAADQALYGGAHICAIWEAFARRGLGFSASQGSTGSKTDGTEAFDLPPSFSSLDVIDEVCLSDGIQTGLSGGNPSGGVYSGVGVVDDGNGLTFTFDPSVAGPGLVTISYNVNDFCTGTPTVLTDTINVTNDPPEIICMGSGAIPMSGSQSSNVGVAIPDGNPTGITASMNVTENVSISDLNINLNITHSWVGDVIVSIKSPAGTIATIFDRPGVPSSTYGCSGNNILATMDDEAATAVENQCAGSEPTINGSFIPNNPLSIFDGENTAGIWELKVSDAVGGDTGSLISWGMDYEYQITAPILDITLDVNGNATINAADLLFSASVDCGGISVLAGSPLAATISFTCADIGNNTIIVQATNDSGASSTCSAIVNVIGSGSGGTLVCPGNISQNNDLGICGATVSYTIDSPAGCGGGTLTQTGGLPTGSVFPVGTTTNTFQYDDGINPVQTCSFEVTINDTELPAAICQNITVQLGVSGSVSINAADLNNGSTDNCAIDTYSLSKSTFSCADIGANNVTLTVTDVNGNAATCVAVVIVEDNVAPTAICQNITVQLDATGNTTITASDLDGGSNDACGIDSLAISTSSFSCANIGANNVTLTVTDVNGNVATCVAVVTVEDNIAPSAVCQNITIQLDASGNATINANDLDGGSTDACGISAISISQTSFSCADIGDNNITFTVTDNNANSSTCMAIVTVEDVSAPQLVCPLDQTQDTGAGNMYVVPDYFASGEATATDNCTDPVTLTTQDPVAGTSLPVGGYTVTLTAEDEFGNIASCLFELKVNGTAGVGDNNSLSNVNLYPNPAKGFIILTNPQMMQLDILKIYDLRGRLIKTVDIRNMGLEKSIDVADMASATYFIMIEGKNAQITKRLIKE